MSMLHYAVWKADGSKNADDDAKEDEKASRSLKDPHSNTIAAFFRSVKPAEKRTLKNIDFFITSVRSFF